MGGGGWVENENEIYLQLTSYLASYIFSCLPHHNNFGNVFLIPLGPPVTEPN